jgi:hypothetical protein
MKRVYFFLPLFSLAFFACRKTPDTTPLTVGFVVQTAKEPGQTSATTKHITSQIQ